uniref:Uncharacterized protein n=1 Tax=Arundo donax TaxID=35708 RepID=A0A0A9E0P7_ARUDO
MLAVVRRRAHVLTYHLPACAVAWA